jgi:magnesium transporter
MNVHVPGQDADGLTWFFSIIGCLGAIALGGAWMTYRVSPTLSLT